MGVNCNVLYMMNKSTISRLIWDMGKRWMGHICYMEWKFELPYPPKGAAHFDLRCRNHQRRQQFSFHMPTH